MKLICEIIMEWTNEKKMQVLNLKIKDWFVSNIGLTLDIRFLNSIWRRESFDLSSFSDIHVNTGYVYKIK